LEGVKHHLKIDFFDDFISFMMTGMVIEEKNSASKMGKI